MPVIDDSHPKTLEGLQELFRQKDEEGEPHEFYYQQASTRLVTEFEKTAFWTEFARELAEISVGHRLDRKLSLLAPPGKPPVLLAKPWDSLIDKCYRKNVVKNSLFPKAPPGGWITEENWLDMIHDVVRATVVVRYLEDIVTVANLLEKVAVANDAVKIKVSYKARDEGYYAVHVSIPMRLQYGEFQGENLFVNIQVELQLCTQIQEVIRSLTHVFYKKRRVKQRPRGQKWQWECESDEFVPNYLGHMLQFADGMIMNSWLRMSNE